MNNISAIDHLYAFEDGDTITPGMGVRWVNGETGLGLQQYWNPTTGKVIATDFKEHPVMLYPQPYSSKKGAIVLPEANGQQWYYGNISTEGGRDTEVSGGKTIRRNGKRHARVSMPWMNIKICSV